MTIKRNKGGWFCRWARSWSCSGAIEDKEDFVWPGISWWLVAAPLAIVLLLNLVERRFWCRYLCPLGALVGLGSKFSWVKRLVNL